MNIIIEGCDCVGKTSLIAEFLKLQPNYRVVKCSAPKDKEAAREEYTRIVKEIQLQNNIIFDRALLGEKVYAPVFRGYYPEYMDELEEQCNNALVVLLTANPKIALQRFDGKFIDADQIPNIMLSFFEEFHESKYPKKMILDSSYLKPNVLAEILWAAVQNVN